MIREIKFNGTIIQYNLQYKNVKNINIRIKPDGSINVSANKCVPLTAIDDFALSKADFIIRALERYKNMPVKEQKQYYTEGELKELILTLCNKAYPYYEKRGIRCPEVKIKRMVSQWGSCHTKKGILTFSTNLMYAPAECIEYVVWHEFTHFLQPNHSSKFYDELVKVCPNWTECRKGLMGIRITL